MKRLFFILLWVASLTAHAQSDSLYMNSTPFLLESVLVQTFKIENDRLQNFYKSSPSATTENVLCHLQGVSLIRRGAYGQEPMIRGLSAGQLSVTIDGMKMFGACTDKMDPVSIYIEPQNLKNISVAIGSSGSSFGSTVGGSIDMQLAEPTFANTISGKAGVTYQNVLQGLTAFTVLNKSLSKSAFRFSSVYRNSQNYRAGGGDVVPYSQYEKLNLTLGAKWGLGARDTVRADVLADYGWNIGFPALPMDVGLATTYMAGVSLTKHRPESFMPLFRLKGYVNSVYHEMDDTHRENVTMHMDMPGSSITYGVFAEGELKKTGKHFFKFRTDGYVNTALAEMTMYPENDEAMYMQTWPSSSRGVFGVYGSDAYDIDDLTQLSMSARLDWSFTNIKEGIGLDQLHIFYPETPKTQQQVAGSASLILSRYFLRDFRFSLQGGYSQRIPTLTEYAGFYLYNRMDGYDYIGNPALQTEKNWNGNAIVNYLGRSIEAEINVFTQQFQDYIFSRTDPSLSAMTPGANGVRVYENIKAASFNGIETKLSWKITRGLQLMDQVKYVRATTFGGDPLPLIPPLTHQFSVRYGFKSFSVQADVEQAASQNYINESFGEDVTPGYTIASLLLNYQVSRKQTTFVFQTGVENLFDEYYHGHLDWGNIPRPGRNVYVTLEIRF